MEVPHRVFVDRNAPFPDLCTDRAREAGFAIGDDTGWPRGQVLVRGLCPDNVKSFLSITPRHGPLVALVRKEDLGDDAVSAAASAADAMGLLDDGPEVIHTVILIACERWGLQARLRESEERFRFLAENAGDVIWSWDLDHARFDFVSPSVTRLRGISVAEAMAESLEQSLSPESVAKVRAQLAAGLAGGHSNRNHPLTDMYEQPHKDGGTRIVEITISLLRDPDGRPRKLLGVSRDATERMAAERELKAALDERDTLLRELGHRIKNTLALTASLLSLARGRVRDPADGELFDESRERVGAMAALYNRLMKAGASARIDLAGYLDELCAGLSSAYLRGEPSVQVSAQNISVDSKQAVYVGLAVNEAVTNALKYAHVPGRPLSILVDARLRGGELVLSIEDDGCGLPGDALHGDSAGLGLQLIRSLADQLGGSVTVDSTPGRRTSVTMVMPAG